jgi:hypothetical protein
MPKPKSSGLQIVSEDGYKFFVLSNGMVVDNLKEAERDMEWASMADFIDEFDGSFWLKTTQNSIWVDRDE